MPNKGQIISFLIVLAIIVTAGWQAVSHGNSLKDAKELAKPAFIAEQLPQEVRPAPEPQDSDNSSVADNELSDNDNSSMINDGSESAFIVIDDGSGNPKEFVLEVKAGTTAFDLLQEASLTSGFTVESEEYDFGVFVEAINNKRNRQDNRYWLFYVNKELSQLTPDNVTVNPGDKIEFIFTNR